MKTIFSIRLGQKTKNPNKDGGISYHKILNFILNNSNLRNMEPIVLNKKTNTSFRSFYLLMTVLVASFVFSISGVQAQTTVNKRLYMKTVQTLNREVPTAATHQSTIGLFKQTAVLENTSIGKTFPPGTGTAGPLTISHQTRLGAGSGLNRFMIVTIISDPSVNVSTVTYGGVALTKLDDALNGTSVKTEIWYLTQPAIGTANVVINWNPNANAQLIAGVSTFYDVNQETPLGPVRKNIGNTANSNISVPSNAGDLIFDAIGNAKASFTPLASQTPIFNESSNAIVAASSRKIGANGNTAMGWTFNAAPYAHIGVAVKGYSNEVDFTQTPPLCGDLILPAGQSISITAYATATTALTANTGFIAKLKFGTTQFFYSNTATWSGGTTGTLTWTGILPSTVTIPAGSSIVAEFDNDQPGSTVTIDYDATSKISYIQLPTTTYINVNNLSVFNAAFAGGAVITQQAVGVTNYLRAVVSDPFGASDITALNFSIDGGSPIAGTLVNTPTSCSTKTFEYVWTPTTAGAYTITATALEGTEGTVTHTATLSNFQVVQPSLTVTKTKTLPASGPYKINDNITYNIAIQNTGLSTLTQLPLQDLYATSCLQYVSSSIAPTNISGGAITWNNLGPLTAGSTLNVAVTMKVIGNCDPVANTAKVENAKDNLNYVAATQTSAVNISIDEDPVAVSDSFCIQGSTALSVLGNDTDADVAGFLSVPANAALYTITFPTPPAKGSIVVNGDKTLQFNPAGGTPMSENETVTFTYRVAETANPTLFSNATVTVLYSTVNSAPVALNDLAVTTTELPVVINVLANDSDVDGILQAPTVTVNPNFGTVQVNPDKTITYIPFPGFEGTDVFTYQVCDDGCPTPAQCATATVSITVRFAYYVCQEGSSTIQVNPVPGAVSYTWTLPAGAMTTSLITTVPQIEVDWSGVTPGTYNICVEPTNDCGPGTQQCVEVVVNKVALVLTPTQIACNGVNSGSINLAVSGGIAPYIYAWTGPSGYTASVQSPANLAAGTYNVTVTDKYGCTATGNATINAPPSAIVVNTTLLTHATPAGAANGAIDISVSGGTGSYTYLWSNGATSEDVTGLAGGSYNVTVTDANGCSVVKYFTVNNVGGPLTISSNLLTHVKCNGGSTGAIDIEVIGGTGTYTYSWTRDGGGFTASTQDISSIPAGTYNVTVSSPGYTSIVLTGIVINQPTALSASSIKTDVTCFGQSNGSVTVIPSGGTAPYTYLWNTGATTQNLIDVGPGTYSVTITDANLCTATTGQTITEPTPLVVTSTVNNASCNPITSGSITLTSVSGGTAPYTFAWSNGATTQDIAGLSPGTYAVTITDFNGCKTGRNFVVQEACLDVTKTLFAGPVNNGDGSYTVTYQLSAKNTGETALTNVQLSDNLVSAFPSPASFSLPLVTSSKPSWLNGGYDGNTNALLFIANQALISGDMVSVNITVTVTPGIFAISYNNIVNGSAVDNTGVTTSDQANQNITFTENPIIGVAKALTAGPAIKLDGSYDLSFTITVRNYGDVPLNNVQVTDNLDAAFGAGTYSVTSLTASTGFTANWPAGFNGSTVQNLLAASTPMAINEIRTIVINLNVTPTTAGPFANQATGSATGPGGTSTTDLSQNGLNPDPDNDDNPANNNVVTPVTFPENPEIGLAKRLVSAPINNNDGTYTLTYEFRVKNTGDVILYNVQVTDNLTTTFSGATVVVNSINSTNFTVNNLYTGTGINNLLSATGNTLAVGETKIITLSVDVAPGTNLGPNNNSATASGTSAFGTTKNDISHDGISVDPNNTGPGNHSTPTPVTFTESPLMGLAKAVSTVTNNNNGTYDVTYTINVRNYGDVPLNIVQVTDNLATTFTGAASYTVQSINASGTLAANTVGDFNTTNNLLVAASSTVAYNITQTITLVVRVTPGTKLGTYNNAATGTATGPGGTTISDVSQNGINPDPDNDGNPGNNSLVTPVSFSENPAIAVTKTIVGSVSQSGNNYTLTYQIRVENTGDVPLNNLQLNDDLASAFTGASGYVVNSTTITTPPANTTLVLNGGFNGVSNPNLLNGTGTLLFGEFAVIQIQVTVTAISGTHPGGPYINEVASLANSPAGRFLIDLDDVEVTLFENPAIKLTKTVESIVDNGDGTNSVTFKLLIENTGDVNLNNLKIFDDIVTQFSAFNPTNFAASEGLSLAVNPLWNGTATSNILDVDQYFDPEVTDPYYVFISFDVTPGFTASQGNTATASGTGPLGGIATGADTETLNFLRPAISLVKQITSGSPYNAVGDLINYSFVITNTGGVTLSGPFTVTDDKIATVPNGTGPLAPGASVTVTATYTITQGDLNAGSVTNTATASTSYATLTVTSNQDQATAETGIADLSLTKVAQDNLGNPLTEVAIGGTIYFKITLTNSGPASTTGVTVKDILPVGLALVSYKTFVNTVENTSITYDSSTGIWDLNSLTINMGDVIILEIQTTAGPNCGPILNSAQILTSSRPDSDSTPGNNQ